jgi:hypothetical protein
VHIGVDEQDAATEVDDALHKITEASRHERTEISDCDGFAYCQSPYLVSRPVLRSAGILPPKCLATCCGVSEGESRSTSAPPV